MELQPKMECPNCHKCELEVEVVVKDYFNPNYPFGHGQIEEDLVVCPECDYVYEEHLEREEFEPELGFNF